MIRIRSKIKNALTIEVDGVDATAIKNIEVYIKQGELFYQLTPVVVDKDTLLVTLDKDKAMELRPMEAYVQIAYTDDSGTPGASDIACVQVKDLLKEAGYGS